MHETTSKPTRVGMYIIIVQKVITKLYWMSFRCARIIQFPSTVILSRYGLFNFIENWFTQKIDFKIIHKMLHVYVCVSSWRGRTAHKIIQCKIMLLICSKFATLFLHASWHVLLLLLQNIHQSLILWLRVTFFWFLPNVVSTFKMFFYVESIQPVAVYQ